MESIVEKRAMYAGNEGILALTALAVRFSASELGNCEITWPLETISDFRVTPRSHPLVQIRLTFSPSGGGGGNSGNSGVQQYAVLEFLSEESDAAKAAADAANHRARFCTRLESSLAARRASSAAAPSAPRPALAASASGVSASSQARVRADYFNSHPDRMQLFSQLVPAFSTDAEFWKGAPRL